MQTTSPVAILPVAITNRIPMYVEHLRIPVDGGTLHAERHGRGNAAVVLVHGFGTNASLWRPVSARLANAGYLVVAPDLLGNGESDRPLDASYDLASQADVLERALAALRIGRAIVVGQDVGGLVGLALASRFPARVAKLVLLNPPDLTDLPPAPVRMMQKTASRLALGVSSSRLDAAALISTLLTDAVADPAGLPPSALARYLAPWAGPGGVEQLQVLARALESDHVSLEALSGVSTPTLIVRGAHDRSVPPTVALALASALPNATLTIVPTMARLLADDAPDALARILLDWMPDATPAHADA